MTQDEWLETGAADAITNFLAVTVGTLASGMGGVVGGFLTKVGTSFLTFLMDEQKEERGDTRPDDKLTQKLRHQLDPDREDPRRNGLIIVAIWSAFESSFDDFAKALIVERPGALKNKDISRMKVPMFRLFDDGEDKAEVVLDGIKEAVGRGAGVSRCEKILKYLDLSGPVPREIKDPVYYSQMIRHVWAHRIGVADTQFVAKAGKLGFSVGDLVAVDTQQLVDYLSAIVMYAMIMMNRHRHLHGLEPVTGILDSNETTNGSMREAFHKLYATECSE